MKWSAGWVTWPAPQYTKDAPLACATAAANRVKVVRERQFEPKRPAMMRCAACGALPIDFASAQGEFFKASSASRWGIGIGINETTRMSTPPRSQAWTSFFFRPRSGAATDRSRVELWTGFSMARRGSRISLLSLGMEQFRQRDLFLEVPLEKAGFAIQLAYDLLDTVIREGKPFPEGDTVGRTADEKMPIHYRPSPIGPPREVWTVEVP